MENDADTESYKNNDYNGNLLNPDLLILLIHS